MSRSDRKGQIPSSISRGNRFHHRSDFSNILGKRKSEWDSNKDRYSQASAKRHATTPSWEEARRNEEIDAGAESESESTSSSLDSDGPEHVEYGRRAKLEGSTPPSPTLCLTPALPYSSRKHILTARRIRRRHSFSSLPSAKGNSSFNVENNDSEDAGRHATSQQRVHRPGFPVVYRILCSDDGHKSKHHETFLYEDDPLTAVPTNGRQSSHLSGNSPIYQLRDYLNHFKQSSFVIFKNRNCESKGHDYLSQMGCNETMLIVNDDLQLALKKVATCPFDGYSQHDKESLLEMGAPYKFLYLHRKRLQIHSQSLTVPLRIMIEAVLDYVKTNYGHEFAEAAELMSEGKITIRHLDKIYQPNQLVIKRGYMSSAIEDMNVYVLENWTNRYSTGPFFKIECWRWMLSDFHCYRQNSGLGFSLPVEDENEPFPIDKLAMCPASFLNEESIEILRKRGKACWNLRRPSFVSYSGENHIDEYGSVKLGRFKIDVKTYNQLHRIRDFSDRETKRNKQTDPWRLEIHFTNEPTEDEFLMMPSTMSGYNLLEKEWVDLSVSNIKSIRWNKQPFEDLVLPKETKDLVRAMVTVRASSIKQKQKDEGFHADFDVIPGKGNGLIMLFHGSPGTGKTLTAESVAEIAEMPLYPITCGDIGIDPDKVEQYLQLVFELGKRWNCVLLLDEADVFLEERSLTDLQRNSLVSVFLRMIEYYEGILILTSNRVGTFDEAFRSRIHIALHYEDLNLRSRKQIWLNFLSRLEGTEEGENVEVIIDRVDELAVHKLNGREIRNALSTARQLASHVGEKMRWEHMELAIKTANDFGSYLRDVHGHSDREWARESRKR